MTITTTPYFEQRICVFQEPTSDGMTRLVVGNGLFLIRLQHLRLFLQTSHHSLNRLFKVLHVDGVVEVSRGNQRSLVAYICNVGTCQSINITWLYKFTLPQCGHSSSDSLHFTLQFLAYTDQNSPYDTHIHVKLHGIVINNILLLHLFNAFFTRTTWVSWHEKGKPFWILLDQEMMGWHQLDHTQIICTSLQTDNHVSTSPLSFYRPDALPAIQPTASKH